MRALLWVVSAVAVVSLLGCGAHCDDSAMKSQAVAACAAGSSPLGYCQCVTEYIYERYTCDALTGADVTLSDVIGACEACAPQYGFSTADCHTG